MSAASNPVQAALYTRLRAFAGLTALLAASVIDGDSGSGVYDGVPPQPALPEGRSLYPFVQIGEEVAVPFDTDLVAGQETVVTIHSWSRETGSSRKKVKDIGAQLHAALHDHALSVSGHHTVLCLWELAETIPDPDPTIQHRIDRFRITTQDT